MFGILAATLMTATRHDLPAVPAPAPHPARRTGPAHTAPRDTPPAR